MQVRRDGHQGTFQHGAAAVPAGGLHDQTIPRADVRGTVFFGIFANNTLDFAKIETTTSKHFTLPEKKKKIATRIIHACNVLIFYAPWSYKLILRRTQ